MAALPPSAHETSPLHARFQALLASARGEPAVRTAIVHPCEPGAMTGAVEAAREGLIEPVLVGPRGKVLASAERAGVDVSAYELVDTPHSHAAAARAVALVREGRWARS